MKKWFINGNEDWTNTQVRIADEDGSKDISEKIHAMRITIKSGNYLEATIAESLNQFRVIKIKNLKIEFEEYD